MTFQSISLAAIGGYLMTMVLVTSALQLIGGPAARMAQVSFVFAASLAALILLPSSRFRGWFRVERAVPVADSERTLYLMTSLPGAAPA